MDFFYSSQPPPPSRLSHLLLRRTFSSGSYRDAVANYNSARMAIRTIIGLNSVVFGAWIYAQTANDRRMFQRLYESFTLSISNWRAGRYWTLLTSAFSHQHLMHFAFNIIAFNAFGSVLLASGLGAVHIIALALGSAIAGSVVWLYQRSPSSPQPAIKGGFINQRQPLRQPSGQISRGPIDFTALGASGMVMGAGAAATCLMPMAPTSFLFLPFTMPLYVLMGIYVGVDLALLGNESSRVGHSAHLGGAVYGAVFYLGFLRRYGGVWSMVRRALRR